MSEELSLEELSGQLMASQAEYLRRLHREIAYIREVLDKDPDNLIK